MSATCPPVEKAQNINVKRVKIHSPSQLPNDYGTTPGGTLYATTPGGTRIIYERSFLLECRNSPLAQSPLANLPKIPGVTCGLDKPGAGSPRSKKAPRSPLASSSSTENKPQPPSKENRDGSPGNTDDPQFHMDM